MRECHIAINVLAFSCGIWIYKVKHDFKIPWELPRWQNKQSQAFIPGHIKLQLSLSDYVPEQILSVQFFLQSTLTESHFPESPPSSQSTTPSSKFSTMEMEKVVAEKLDGCSSKCSSTLVQCWRNWTIVKFGRFVTELRTIGPLSILPQFRHHFTIGCHPLFPSPPAQASIPPHPCSHFVILVFLNCPA